MFEIQNITTLKTLSQLHPWCPSCGGFLQWISLDLSFHRKSHKVRLELEMPLKPLTEIRRRIHRS